jgi:hypothetical protein
MQRVLHHLSTEQHLNGEADESVVPIRAELAAPAAVRFPGRAVLNALVRQDRG